MTAALEAVAAFDADSTTLAGVALAGFPLLFARGANVSGLAVALVAGVGELARSEDARL